MWLLRFLWLDITELCLDDKCGGKTVDGVTEGKVRSEYGQKGLSHQREGDFAWVRWCGTPNGDLFGVGGAIPHPSRVPKQAEWQDRSIIPEKIIS